LIASLRWAPGCAYPADCASRISTMWNCTPCSASDRTTDTVKVDLSKFESEDKENIGNVGQKCLETKQKLQRSEAEDENAKAQQRREAQAREEAERALEEERLEQERLEQEHLERERLERERLEQERLEAERLELQRLEEERREAAAEAKRQHEAEVARQEEERLQREKEAQEEQHRQAIAEADASALSRFLDDHKYTSVNDKRKTMFKFKYPLHTAVKLKDTDMIRVLLAAHADPTLKNSAHETPLELAERLFKKDEQARNDIQEALRGCE